MSKSIFDLEAQHENTSSKVVASLERLSEVFRVLLWEHAKTKGISPIQIQLLIFLAYHKEELCNVTQLALEFNMTKATISDAIRVLHNKGYLEKHYSTTDRRAFSIHLTIEGQQMVSETEDFPKPIKKAIQQLDPKAQQDLFLSLNKVIYSLNRLGLIKVQRTCLGCRYYREKGSLHYCQLLQKVLKDQDLRIDCPEYETKA